MSKVEDNNNETWSSVQTRDSGRASKDIVGIRLQCLTICGHADLRRVGNYSQLRDLCFDRFVDQLYMVKFCDAAAEEYWQMGSFSVLWGQPLFGYVRISHHANPAI